MKKYLLLLAFSGLTAAGFAQAPDRTDITIPKEDVVFPGGEVLQVKQAPQNIGRVYGTVGAVYSDQQLFNMPSRQINRISSMTLGVQWNYGQDPIFKGAPGGTAYFVDGIRIRSGSLGIAGFTF